MFSNCHIGSFRRGDSSFLHASAKSLGFVKCSVELGSQFGPLNSSKYARFHMISFQTNSRTIL